MVALFSRMVGDLFCLKGKINVISFAILYHCTVSYTCTLNIKFFIMIHVC